MESNQNQEFNAKFTNMMQLAIKKLTLRSYLKKVNSC
jgi:hypothetical protein